MVEWWLSQIESFPILLFLLQQVLETETEPCIFWWGILETRPFVKISYVLRSSTTNPWFRFRMKSRTYTEKPYACCNFMFLILLLYWSTTKYCSPIIPHTWGLLWCRIPMGNYYFRWEFTMRVLDWTVRDNGIGYKLRLSEDRKKRKRKAWKRGNRGSRRIILNKHPFRFVLCDFWQCPFSGSDMILSWGAAYYSSNSISLWNGEADKNKFLFHFEKIAMCGKEDAEKVFEFMENLEGQKWELRILLPKMHDERE